MQDSRLFTVFDRLSNREISALGLFVRSPFFNQRQEVIRLYEYLAECKTLLLIWPEKKKAFGRTFPGEAYQDGKMRKYMSHLMRLLEQFLVYKQMEKDEISMGIALTGAYRDLNLEKHFRQSLREAEKRVKAAGLENADHFLDRYQLQSEEYEFARRNRRIGEFNLQETSDTIDVFYLAHKLRNICFLLSHQAVYNTQYDLGMISVLFEQANWDAFLDIPAIAIYYYCYQALTSTEGDTEFKYFKQLLFLHDKKFPQHEVHELYLLALNYCIKNFNAGQESYAQECFELYQEGLQREWLFEDGNLSRFAYNNIVSISLTIGEYDWVEQFIPDYRDKLEYHYRESNYSFNLARLQYERQQYDKALILLQKSEYKDLLLNLSAKAVMLKIYYELGEYDLLFSHLDALQIFIKRKKGIGYHEKNYRNLIRFTRQLLELPPGDREALEGLKKTIGSTKVVAERRWLLAQLG